MIILVGKHIEMPEGTGQELVIVKAIIEMIEREEGFKRFMVSA
jgi:hypothetical protein